jgi:RNA polymerase sigma factor (sigma-70 family)
VGIAARVTSDADLVRAALSGAKEPLGELLSRHWTTAVALAARVLGSADLARDAAQEAAVAVMTDLTALRSPDRFGAWFCGIALNVSRRWLRQLRAEYRTDQTGLAADGPGPAEQAETADLVARVRAAVSALPPGQRDAVWLFYLQGLTHREVAADLRISIGAVKARLHQARASLAPALAELSEAPELSEEKGTDMTGTDTGNWSEVTVAGILRSQAEDDWQRQHVMVLQDRDSERRLPIWIGPAEAITMALALESVETPRPFTARLAASLVEAAGASIAEVRITRLLEGVFYATVLVDGPAGVQEVDARPSDAVNLALAAGRPIKVDAALYGAETPANRAEELATFPVATADIAAEVQQAHCERRKG